MAKEVGDPRHPAASDYDSLMKVVTNHTPGDVTRPAWWRAYEDAADHFRKGEMWTAPDGCKIEALRHERELAAGIDPLRCQIVGYRKLRDNEWFVASGGEVLHGPLKTFRHAKYQVGVKSARTEQAGWYTANGCDIFRRDMAEEVLGRPLTHDER